MSSTRHLLRLGKLTLRSNVFPVVLRRSPSLALPLSSVNSLRHRCDAKTPNLSGVKPKTAEVTSETVFRDADSLNYSDLREEDISDIMTFMGENFFPREPVSKGLHMTYEDNKEWLTISVKQWLQSGVSVLARDPASGKLIGMMLATILTRDQSKTFEEGQEVSNSKVRTLHTVLATLEEAVDFFARYEKVNSILEFAMLSVLDEYSGKGIGRKIIKESETRGLKLGCQLATAQSTAIHTQQLHLKNGYKALYTMDYATFEIDGKKIFDMEKMGSTTTAKVMAKVIDKDLQKEIKL